tara:strand:+ start:594 stop:1382 length:789 start_codon:yes stop_codon:yes gene_type:complete
MLSTYKLINQTARSNEWASGRKITFIMDIARNEQGKRQEAAHKELMRNLSKVQEKIEDLADSSLLTDEAFRQLSNSNKDLYNSMKTMIEGLNQLHIVYQETIMESRMVNKWNNPSAAKNRCQLRQEKQNKSDIIRCPCGEFISKSYFDKHKKNQSHQDALLRINIDKMKVLQVQGVDKLLTLNAHLNAMKNNRKAFRYAPECWLETYYSENIAGDKVGVVSGCPRRYSGDFYRGQYSPMYLLEQWIRRFRIKKLGYYQGPIM